MNRKNLIRMSLKHLMRLNEGVTRTSTIGELLASGDITESTTVAELMSMMSVGQQSATGDKKGIDPEKLKIAKDSIAYYLNASYGKFAGNYGDVIGGKKVGFGKKDCEKMLDEVFLKMGMPCPPYNQPGCARFYVDAVFAEFVDSGILVTNAGTVANAAGTRYASPKDIPVSQGFDFKGSLKEFRSMGIMGSDIDVFPDSEVIDEKMYYINDINKLKDLADINKIGEEIAMYVEEYMEYMDMENESI